MVCGRKGRRPFSLGCGYEWGQWSVRKYLNKPMGELAAELTAGLMRLRRGYVDAAESLIRILSPDQQYPYEFAVYRITGYRGRRSGPASEPMPGASLRQDLRTLMLDLCDSLNLPTSDYPEPAHDSNSLARRFSVSTKTIQRWRLRGLPARRLLFPDGKKRVAFMESSVRWFVSQRQDEIDRSTQFSQLSDAEREEIVRRARDVAAGAGCSPSEVARLVAARTGRAWETIRSLILAHDRRHPDDRIFASRPARLDAAQKLRVYRLFLRGVPAGVLSARFRRSRGSIYRIVNEVRAKQLASLPIGYIYNGEFDSPGADKAILASQADQAHDAPQAAPAPRPKAGELPPYLQALYDVPLLDPQSERDLFRRYNYLKYKADKLRAGLSPRSVRASRLKQIEQLLLQANLTKNRIIRANLRLVVSIAKKHVSGPQTLFELVSDGNVSLIQAAEKFDYARGYRFSTYASWAIMRNFARSVPKERHQLDRFTTGYDELLNIASGLRTYDPNRLNIPELRETIDAVLAQLLPRERAILLQHYGLDENGKAKTLSELGKELGLSKERVRQIELDAMEKLRKMLPPRESDLLG